MVGFGGGHARSSRRSGRFVKEASNRLGGSDRATSGTMGRTAAHAAMIRGCVCSHLASREAGLDCHGFKLNRPSPEGAASGILNCATRTCVKRGSI